MRSHNSKKKNYEIKCVRKMIRWRVAKLSIRQKSEQIIGSTAAWSTNLSTKNRVFKKKNSVNGYEYDPSISVYDRMDSGPFNFPQTQPSVFASEVNIAAELARTGSRKSKKKTVP